MTIKELADMYISNDPAIDKKVAEEILIDEVHYLIEDDVYSLMEPGSKELYKHPASGREYAKFHSLASKVEDEVRDRGYGCYISTYAFERIIRNLAIKARFGRTTSEGGRGYTGGHNSQANFNTYLPPNGGELFIDVSDMGRTGGYYPKIRVVIVD